MTETGDLSTVPAKTREYRKDSIHRPLRRHLHGDSPYRFTHPQARFDKPLLAGSWYFGKRSALSTGGSLRKDVRPRFALQDDSRDLQATDPTTS